MRKTGALTASERSYKIMKEKDIPVSSYYGEDTFNFKIMSEKLSRHAFSRFMETLHDGRELDSDTANAVAHAMKEWAIERGATHYSHWFQPMTGSTAEKHDSFIEPTKNGEMIERFTGKQLVQGEPDASSFPSGGIRSTFEARGYTGWDASSPAFILKSGIGTTLCIPSVFISYSGEALDKKTPLLRSIEALNKTSVNLMRLLGNKEVKRVSSTLGPEQEYFLIDQDFYYKRQDLVLTGRTLLGAAPPKGQQLEDQYFGSIKERVLSFMHDVEEELYRLGIPAKTRHNEVAPSQFEIAPLFEEANIAVDHNQLLMEVLKKTALNHKLAVLLHEKPFSGINGSGKHLNWSLQDDAGNNLLNPGKTPHDNIQFLLFLIAVIRAVYLHADLLRASVSSSGNDHRLGANEAPPAIISVFLGEQLSRILDDIEKGVITRATNEAIIDLGISTLPVLSKDSTDRNRTSPFAFTGNKFEFRAVGSSQSISFPATVLNTIVSESLEDLSAKIKTKGGDVRQASLDIIREEIKSIRPILYMGDNYTMDWEREAAKRGLPNKKTSAESLPDLVTEDALALFEKYGVLSRVELRSRYIIRVERYFKEIEIEALTLMDIAATQIIPAAMKFQKALASSIEKAANVLGEDFTMSGQRRLLKTVASEIDSVISLCDSLSSKIDETSSLHDEQEKAVRACTTIRGAMNDLRAHIDALERLVNDELWPLPKFWEMLFIS